MEDLYVNEQTDINTDDVVYLKHFIIGVINYKNCHNEIGQHHKHIVSKRN